jgi:hypothetical protein
VGKKRRKLPPSGWESVLAEWVFARYEEVLGDRLGFSDGRSKLSVRPRSRWQSSTTGKRRISREWSGW